MKSSILNAQNKSTFAKSTLPLSITIILAMTLSACDLQEIRERQLKEQKQRQDQNIISKVESPKVEQPEKIQENKEIKVVNAKVNPSDNSITNTATAEAKKNQETDEKINAGKKLSEEPKQEMPSNAKKVKETQVIDVKNGIAKPTEQQRSKDSKTNNTPNKQQNTFFNTNKVVTVSVIPAKLVTVPHAKTFTGTTSAFETLQVQPNGNGTVSEIYFKQGNWIRAGAPLYRITPTNNSKKSLETTKASIKQAKANLSSAKAGHKHAKALLKTHQSLLVHAQDDLNRYEKLIADKIVSEQTYQQAVNEVQTAKSAIKSTKALISQTATDIKTAKANVELTNSYLSDEKAGLEERVVKAPLTGVIVDSQIVKGKKVNTKQADSFVTIATVNPIFVDVHPSSDEMLTLQKGFNQKKIKGQINKAKLLLDNGKGYASSGAFKFSETKVDENNQVTMKVLFDNPKGQLLPNMKVTVQLPMPKMVDVVLIPPTAVQNSIIVNTAAPDDLITKSTTATTTVTKEKETVKNIDVSKEKKQAKKTSDDKITANKEAKTSDANTDTKKSVKDSNQQVATKTEPRTNGKQSDKKMVDQSKNTHVVNEAAKQNHSKRTVANFVYVVDKDKRVQTRNVTINPDNDYHGRLIVEKGLKQGDKVIVDSDDILLPRQLVAIKGEEESKSDKTTTQTASTSFSKKTPLKLYPWQFLTDK